MIDLLEQHRDAIAELCRRHRVAKLDVFGSASTGEFDPRTSDFDFLITMHEMDVVEYKNHYFAFWDAMEELLDRQVDLVTEKYIRNPFFKRSIEQTRTMLYAA